MIIYFHADDAGIGLNATKMIVECWEKDYINGFSIIANKECYKVIEQSLERNVKKNCDIAAHMKLTDGKSISEPALIPDLLNKKQQLAISFSTACCCLMRSKKRKKSFLRQVYKEWDAQITFVKKICGQRKIKSLNGHNHIHMIPSFFFIAVRLAKKHGIEQIRFSKEFFFVSNLFDCVSFFFWVNYLKKIVLWICQRIIYKGNVVFSSKTDSIIGIQYTGRMLPQNIKAGIRKARMRNVKSVEVIVHPGWSPIEEIANDIIKAGAVDFFSSNWRKIEYETVKTFSNESSN